MDSNPARSRLSAHLQRGLQIVSNLTDDDKAQRLEADLLVSLGPALIVLLGYAAPDVGRTYERLRSLIDRNGDLAEYLAPTQQGLRLYLLWCGELSAAGKVAAELLEQGNRTGDLSQRLEGHKAVAICDLWGGQLEASRKEFLSALAIADAMPQARSDPVRYDADSRSTCLSILSWNEWMLGRPARAEEISLKAVAAARASGHHFTLGEILSLRCWFLHLQRRHDEAMPVSLETQKLALERDFPVWRALAQIVEGSCRVSNGDLHGGAAKIEQALGVWIGLGCALWLPHHYAVLAVGQLRLGDLAQARELLETAKATARKSQELFWMPELQRLEASVIWQAGEPAATEEMLNLSIREARRQGAKMWEVRATRDLARVLAEHGQPEVAREQLSLVYSQFFEGFDTPDLRDVNTLLENLSSETGIGSRLHS